MTKQQKSGPALPNHKNTMPRLIPIQLRPREKGSSKHYGSGFEAPGSGNLDQIGIFTYPKLTKHM